MYDIYIYIYYYYIYIYIYIYIFISTSASLFSRGSTRFLIDCKSFLSVSLDVIRIFMSTVSFVTQLDSGIPCLLKCFHLNYDLTGFKSRVNRHLLPSDFF